MPERSRQRGAEPAAGGSKAGVSIDRCLCLYGIQKLAAPLPSRDGERPGRRLLVIEEGQLRALAEGVSRSEFSDTNLANPDWLLARLTAHEKLVEEVMAVATVVPSRFGALFTSADALRQRLRDEQARLLAVLERLEDCEEWAVELACQPSAGNAEAPAAAAAPMSGIAFLTAKKQQQVRRQRLQETSVGAGQRLLAKLEALACESVWMPAPVAKAALLVPRTARDRFLSQTQVLAGRAGRQGLLLRCSGPWPPYNFCGSEGVGEQRA